MVYNKHIDFEFDPHKSRSNKIKHGIDFNEAQELWRSPTLELPLKTEDESRWIVIGTIFNRFWSAIITKRRKMIRIISVRRSRSEEKQVYQDIFKKENF